MSNAEVLVSTADASVRPVMMPVKLELMHEYQTYLSIAVSGIGVISVHFPIKRFRSTIILEAGALDVLADADLIEDIPPRSLVSICADSFDVIYYIKRITSSWFVSYAFLLTWMVILSTPYGTGIRLLL